MDITIRLYKLHDYDLVYLYKNINFPIREAMYRSLSSYVRNEPVFFEIPILTNVEDNLGGVKNVQFHINLDDENDKDLIEYLKKLKPNLRNSFLKNNLRGHLVGSASYVYEKQINLEKTEAREDSIKNSILGTETLKLKKPRKKKKYILLTKDQKELLDMTKSLDGIEVKIVDQNKEEKEK